MMNINKRLESVELQMQPGVITLDGFLGKDCRGLKKIFSEDDMILKKLGLTHARIAERLNYFRELALRKYETFYREGDFEVIVTEARGWLVCPFGERGRFRKGEIKLKNLKSGEKLIFTPLQIHLIEEHGFYGGKGSCYRIEPEQVKDILEI